MVSFQKPPFDALDDRQICEKLKHAAGVWSPVNVIAQKDHHLAGGGARMEIGGYCFHQGLQKIEPTVDVAHGPHNRSVRNGRRRRRGYLGSGSKKL
ncbi:hypothetical protein GCM10007859_01990 [Brevundimonas denitrificans]|uniref:Uncharacterized protein n=1 Tax=Brevundimonas denitrificans TaxID=1443434 RepID=A0ABQ6BDW5_9CAUL|nr:hypothetical protein GCM10007859_01990 [Brevundimonas denitrificans]